MALHVSAAPFFIEEFHDPGIHATSWRDDLIHLSC